MYYSETCMGALGQCGPKFVGDLSEPFSVDDQPREPHCTGAVEFHFTDPNASQSACCLYTSHLQWLRASGGKSSLHFDGKALFLGFSNKAMDRGPSAVQGKRGLTVSIEVRCLEASLPKRVARALAEAESAGTIRLGPRGRRIVACSHPRLARCSLR